MLAILTAMAWAGSAVVVEPERCAATLRAEVETVAPAKPFWVALQLEVEPEWHIYWTNPGEAGLPTELKWRLPPGYRVGEVRWPSPHRFDAGGVVSYGYEGITVVLARIVPPPTLFGRESAIGVDVEYMVCKENCELGSSKAELVLKAGAGTSDPVVASLFERARASLPAPGAALKARAQRTGEGYRLGFALSGKPEVVRATFFSAASGVIEPGAAQVLGRGADSYTLDLKAMPNGKLLGSLDGVLTVSLATKTTESYAIKAPLSPAGGKE